eukprot:TRINITY_DN241785_c0_g1_i2.p1 TRINITY_DN241785_c0_g1~~TRINITY_DN241785_c0_g1_i2.p1  ORF type:complete len:980 (-),score=286.65 TRINITY_DN241785_c0_g1_i2:31-2634(-)
MGRRELEVFATDLQNLSKASTAEKLKILRGDFKKWEKKQEVKTVEQKVESNVANSNVKKIHCKICDVDLIGPKALQKHFQSKQHLAKQSLIKEDKNDYHCNGNESRAVPSIYNEHKRGVDERQDVTPNSASIPHSSVMHEGTQSLLRENSNNHNNGFNLRIGDDVTPNSMMMNMRISKDDEKQQQKQAPLESNRIGNEHQSVTPNSTMMNMRISGDEEHQQKQSLLKEDIHNNGYELKLSGSEHHNVTPESSRIHKIQDTKSPSITKNDTNKNYDFSSCELCGVYNMPNEYSYNQHVNGRRHKDNLMEKNESKPLEESKPVVSSSNKKMGFSCDTCGINGLSIHDYNQHIKGQRHKNKVQSSLSNNAVETVPMVPVGTKFSCKICKIEGMNHASYQHHLEGSRHKAKKTAMKSNDIVTSSSKIESKHQPFVTVVPPTIISASEAIKAATSSNGGRLAKGLSSITGNVGFPCKLCGLEDLGEASYKQHIRGGRHKRALERAKENGILIEDDMIPKKSIVAPKYCCELCGIPKLDGINSYNQHMKGRRHKEASEAKNKVSLNSVQYETVRMLDIIYKNAVERKIITDPNDLKSIEKCYLEQKSKVALLGAYPTVSALDACKKRLKNMISSFEVKEMDKKRHVVQNPWSIPLQTNNVTPVSIISEQLKEADEKINKLKNAQKNEEKEKIYVNANKLDDKENFSFEFDSKSALDDISETTKQLHNGMSDNTTSQAELNVTPGNNEDFIVGDKTTAEADFDFWMGDDENSMMSLKQLKNMKNKEGNACGGSDLKTHSEDHDGIFESCFKKDIEAVEPTRIAESVTPFGQVQVDRETKLEESESNEDNKNCHRICDDSENDDDEGKYLLWIKL